MAEKKKSDKAGRKAKSNSNAAYKSGLRRYTNKLKRVKRHLKRCPNDTSAGAWLKGASGVLAMDYKRGSEVVRKLHLSVYR